MFDSHTHVQFPAYDTDREVVLKRARAAGVHMVAVGTQRSTSESAIALAEAYPDLVWASVGYHPTHLAAAWYYDHKEQAEATPEPFEYERFLALARHPKVVAIGECGLDYYRFERIANRKEQIAKQKEVFLAQVKIAAEVKKPLMIHCRPSRGTDDAYEDLLSILRDSRFALGKILHSYVGSPKVTERFIEAGCYFTFGGVITFTRDYDEVIKMIPLDRILTETDAPYVAPEPHRGKRNEPAYVVAVVKKLAALRGVSLQNLEKQIDENATHVFGLGGT